MLRRGGGVVAVKEFFRELYLQLRVDVVRISVRRGGIHLGFLQDGLDRPVELVFVHNDAGVQFLLLQTHLVCSDGAGAGASWWRCALRSAPRSAPPLPARRAAQRGTKETQQSHFPNRAANEPPAKSYAHAGGLRGQT